MNKKALYESIMAKVAIEVKKALNESISAEDNNAVEEIAKRVRICEESYVEDWNELSNILMPDEGPCETIAGEIIRAVNRIMYRYYNDGDYAGEGYGKETVNPAVRFLHFMASSRNPYLNPDSIRQFNDAVRYFYRCVIHGSCDGNYEDKLCVLMNAAVMYIVANELWKRENSFDMWDFRTEEDVDDSWDYENEDDLYESRKRRKRRKSTHHNSSNQAKNVVMIFPCHGPHCHRPRHPMPPMPHKPEMPQLPRE